MLAHDTAKAFAAVRGENNELLAGGELQEFGGSGRGLGVFQDELQGIDDWVAGDEDSGFENPFGEEGGTVSGGGCEVVRSDLGNEAAVHLLRKWAKRIAGTEAGFYVADRDAVVKAGEGGGEGGGGVALDQDKRWFLAPNTSVFNNPIQARHDPRTNFGGRLVGLHYMEVLI
jgi:hypothetical protein